MSTISKPMSQKMLQSLEEMIGRYNNEFGVDGRSVDVSALLQHFTSPHILPDVSPYKLTSREDIAKISLFSPIVAAALQLYQHGRVPYEQALLIMVEALAEANERLTSDLIACKTESLPVVMTFKP